MFTFKSVDLKNDPKAYIHIYWFDLGIPFKYECASQ